MMKEKIISIIIGIFIYIVVSCTLHSLLGGSHDVALGILYIYSDMLYMAGFTIAFLFYGLGKINKTLHVVFSIKTPWDLLYVIPYGFLGGSFAYILAKKDNIYIPITFHMLHNGILTLLSIVLSVLK